MNHALTLEYKTTSNPNVQKHPIIIAAVVVLPCKAIFHAWIVTFFFFGTSLGLSSRHRGYPLLPGMNTLGFDQGFNLPPL